MSLYPLKFKPIYKERIWGGRQLEQYFRRTLPENKKIGESWEISDLPDNVSVVENGNLAGKTLSDVLHQHTKELIGTDDVKKAFPLLIKILDAEDVLSVQVHPDAEAVKRMGKGDLKTECWYIIDAQPGACIYKGLKKGVTREQFANAIEKGSAAELLLKLPVKNGQCHYLPAGTCHAIGAGLLIAEIQTPSDTTYRVFDWNRVDENGKPRQLHIEEALESINFDQDAASLPITSMSRLVDSEFFKIDKGHQASGCELLLDHGIMKILMFITGCGDIVDEIGLATAFVAGNTILIPADFRGVVRFAEETHYLKVTL